MSTIEERCATTVDLHQPTAARIYDYLLGGGHNFESDRVVAARILEALPNAREIARSNRAFLGRAVSYMLAQGVTQFLDLGAGIPSVGNVHEVAQQTCFDARVVYVDHDPVTVAHYELHLRDVSCIGVVHADLCDVDAVLKSNEVRRLIDFDQPVGLLLVATLHFLSDEQEPLKVVSSYIDRLPVGSYVALSHVTDDTDADAIRAATKIMSTTIDPMYPRSRDQFRNMFTGLSLVSPGVVSTGQWRPERDRESLRPRQVYAGIGRKDTGGAPGDSRVPPGGTCGTDREEQPCRPG